MSFLGQFLFLKAKLYFAVMKVIYSRVRDNVQEGEHGA